jgi:cephalosporin hydroxylase
MHFDMNQRRGIHVFGNPVIQTWFDLFFLNEVLTHEKFDVIIEIGTYLGGLTVFFGMHAVAQDGHVITFDIRPEPEGEPWKTHKTMLPITYYNLNVFEPEVMASIENIINDNRVLLYCDGGDKPREFKTFAPMLNTNDVIMAHDKGREIYENQILQTVTQCGLRPFHQIDADWVGADIFTYIRGGCKQHKQP